METQRLLLLRNLTSTLAKTADLSERRPQQHNSTIKRKNTYNSFQTCANTDSKCSDEERCKFMENRFHVDFLLFCLLETRIHATTDANRRAGFFMHLFSICVNHITFWFHPLLCHYGITMWNMSLAFFVAFICPINNLGKIEGGRGYKVNFRADLICCLVTWFGWSAGVWCKNQEEACSDSRKPVVALPMKHTVYNSPSLNCIIFRVEIEALCIHCYTVLVCSINNSLSRHFPTLTYFIQPRCWFHHKVKYKLSNFFYIYYLPEKIFHL